MPTAPCPACGNDTTVGTFCGACGTQQSVGRTGRLRLGAYAAAPAQRVLTPRLTTSLFPQLPPRSRSRFGVGLLVLAAASVGFAVLRWQAAMIATVAFGLPILFLLYVREIRLRLRDIVVATIVGLALGVAFGVVIGPIVADAYSAALGAQTDIGHVLISGVAIPISEALLMVAPAVVVWVMDRSSRGPLDGFAVGALGATVFNAGTAIALLAPQLAMGVTTHDQSVSSLLAEAIVEGVAWPLASLATGGIFGIALWTRLSGNASRRHRRSVVVAAGVVLVVMTAMGLVDIAPLPLRVYIALQLLIALSAVLALRIGIAGALLHEARDADGADGQLRCPECDHDVAHAPFCTGCGVALHSKSGDARGATYRRVLGPLAAGVGVVVAAAVGAAMLITPDTKAYVCPPDCGRPPLGTPVETNPRFSGDNGAFSVAYPGEGSAYEVTFDPPGMTGVELKYTGGDTGTLRLFGEPARDRTPKQIVQQILARKYPQATVSYEIPNASVGYQPGYGVVADVYSRDSAASHTRLRVIVMAAVKHDYALVAAAVGPYHQFSPDYGTGHPSGANLELAMDMGKYVNSFRWAGDRYGRRP
ncbi:MAG TPA: zinc ribbon domain-containing protein [Mycobacterium sp.]